MEPFWKAMHCCKGVAYTMTDYLLLDSKFIVTVWSVSCNIWRVWKCVRNKLIFMVEKCSFLTTRAIKQKHRYWDIIYTRDLFYSTTGKLSFQLRFLSRKLFRQIFLALNDVEVFNLSHFLPFHIFDDSFMKLKTFHLLSVVNVENSSSRKCDWSRKKHFGRGRHLKLRVSPVNEFERKNSSLVICRADKPKALTR